MVYLFTRISQVLPSPLPFPGKVSICSNYTGEWLWGEVHTPKSNSTTSTAAEGILPAVLRMALVGSIRRLLREPANASGAVMDVWAVKIHTSIVPIHMCKRRYEISIEFPPLLLGSRGNMSLIRRPALEVRGKTVWEPDLSPTLWGIMDHCLHTHTHPHAPTHAHTHTRTHAHTHTHTRTLLYR